MTDMMIFHVTTRQSLIWSDSLMLSMARINTASRTRQMTTKLQAKIRDLVDVNIRCFLLLLIRKLSSLLTSYVGFPNRAVKSLHLCCRCRTNSCLTATDRYVVRTALQSTRKLRDKSSCRLHGSPWPYSRPRQEAGY